LAFMAAQTLLVFLYQPREYRPQPPQLAEFPAELSGWVLFRDDPIGAEVAAELRADATLSRYYRTAGNSAMAHLLVAWFQTQQGGKQPHSPKVCLPASGWTPVNSGETTIQTVDGPISVNRYLVADRTSKAVVLYWYQTPRRAIAGEWSAKFWLLADALRYQRTDTALVRVVVPVIGDRDGEATMTAASFAASCYRRLRTALPL
jgi:EpsI family protein